MRFRRRLVTAVAVLTLFGGVEAVTAACAPPPPPPVATGSPSFEGVIPLTTDVFAEPGHILVGSCTVNLWTHWDLYYRRARIISRTYVTPGQCTNQDWHYKSALAECWVGEPSLGGLNCGLENINAGTTDVEQFMEFVITPTHGRGRVTFNAQLILPSGLVLPSGSSTGKTPEIMCWSELEVCRFQ